MKITKFYGFLPRFRNKEDALKYIECVKDRKPVPAEIWIFPFVERENLGHIESIPNQEYKDAPYECRLI